jgi:hypothetical protein
MTGDEEPARSTDESRLTRRQILSLIGGGSLVAGAGRVGYEYTGFGHVSGTNLVEQSLKPLARRHLEPTPVTLDLSDRRLVFDGNLITLRTDDDERVTSVSLADTDPADAGTFADPVAELVADLSAIHSGDLQFEFLDHEQFFDRLRDSNQRQCTVAALRGQRFRRPSVRTIRQFTGTNPANTEHLVSGLASGFRSATHFDASRYVAGVIEQYLLLDAVPFQSKFRQPTTFEAIRDGSAGLYCAEYALRSVEAFHTIPPHRQSISVFGGIVVDLRHNHAYTALGSVVREDDTLRIPMTFLDFFYSTLYDTLDLEWAFGSGVNAYDEFHRATAIHYDNIYGYYRESDEARD